MTAARTTMLLLLALGASASCEQAPVHAVLYYNFALLPASSPDDHYQQFVDLDGAVVDLGCLVVQRRQVNCFDTAGTGEPNLRLAVVECDCPCTVEEPDPCDPARPAVRAGTIRGLVNQSEGPVVLGGVEIPTEVELADATGLFLVREPNDDPSPLPSTDVVLAAPLYRDGPVIRGNLTSPTNDPVQGAVTIVPVRDEVSL
jgi:hypothetical protein